MTFNLVVNCILVYHANHVCPAPKPVTVLSSSPTKVFRQHQGAVQSHKTIAKNTSKQVQGDPDCS